MNQPHEHSSLTARVKPPLVGGRAEEAIQADDSPLQASQQEALQARIEVLNQKLVASTLARVQKEGALRKSLEQLQQRLAALTARQGESQLQPEPGWAAYLERNAVSLLALAVAVFTLGLHLLD
ncbi:hypothetical protein IAE39_001575 [Pseudomonas sp. S37]|uniref:hypothetical protein n=1 Tax=Pseudomonas sp. S37 TaxID=2767449 RepID=UPI0019134A73|nr:hypothetical protein [Pseudomonas sp. S37]MBK4993401.1 hypothetical protein [Pseudomonas sp. S37]